MNFHFAWDLKTEMADLDKAFKRSFQPWWDSIENYVKYLQNDITWTILPPVVMSIYKYTGHDRQFSIAMTNIFRSCYLAHQIHALVRDDEEGQQHDQQLQFNILIGDYISGHILKSLVDIDADSQVNEFAVMIAEVNEGMLIKHKISGNFNEVIEKTRAPFYSTAFLTAAQLAGFDEINSKIFRDMGFHLGMAIELGQAKLARKQTVAHLYECKKMFMKISKLNYSPNSNLENAIKELIRYYCDVGEFAAI